MEQGTLRAKSGEESNLNLFRQSLTRRLAVIGVLLLFPAVAQGADWPERTVRMIVPFAAGAGADTVGRTFAEELAKALGQPVVVDNKGGAGGLMGTAEGARAPADGYTLLLTSQGATVFNMGLYKSPGYDPLKDLVPVATTGILTNVLVVSSANPATNVAELVAQARAKPGELTYGSSGVGSSLHMSGVILEQRTGVKLQHVPYRGAPAAVLAVVNGEVTMGFFNAPTVLGQIKAGKLKALAVTTKDRSVIVPDVPTMIEAGVPDFVVATWLGFAVPTNTPRAIVSRLNTEINRIAQSPHVKEKLLIQGFEILPPDSPEAARKLIQDDQTLWLPIIKQSGATAE
jgi:tripartite-type tricarboxylate transporter receptor subunit TctC